MNFQASCAICGAPPSKNCSHEDERLKIALFDAQQRWIESDMKAIRHADIVFIAERLRTDSARSGTGC